MEPSDLSKGSTSRIWIFKQNLFICVVLLFVCLFVFWSIVALNAIQQSESALCIHMSPSSWTSLSIHRWMDKEDVAYIYNGIFQFSRSVMSDSLWPHGLQHARPPCPSQTPRACLNSRWSSRWWHPTISSCCPLLLLPSILPSIRVFSNESILCIRWPK